MTCPHCQAPLADGSRFCGACGKAIAPTVSHGGAETGGRERQQTSEVVGRVIAGRYRVVAKLGEGGMGAVFRGEQISLKRAVAIKLLRPEMSSNEVLLRRFNAEAEAVAKLSHPNTVAIYDFGQDTDGSLFIAMELIEGKSLRAALREGPLTPARALAIASQIAASLTDAHSHNIVHRDLKPDNVMLQDRGKARDVVRVLDFGIAKLRDDRATHQMTQAGDMLGTPQYMAPEQIRGDTVDGRTDIYALGCILYEMFTARMPFESTTVMGLLSKHLTEAVVPPSVRRPELGLPPALDAIVLAAMAKSPADRPPTMESFEEQIAALARAFGAPDQSAVGASAAPPAASAAPPAASASVLTPAPASASFGAPIGAAGAVGPAVTALSVAPGAAFTPSPAPQFAPPPAMQTTAVTRGPAKSNAKLIAIIAAVVVLGAAGIAIVVRSSSSVATPPDPWAGTDAATERAPAPDAADAPEPQPDTKTEPTPDPKADPKADPTPDPKADPWAVNDSPTQKIAANAPSPKPAPAHEPQPPPDFAKSPAPTPTPTQISTAAMPMPRGAYLSMPGAATVLKDVADGQHYRDQVGIDYIFAPLVGGSNELPDLARGWVAKNRGLGLRWTATFDTFSAGQPRPTMRFEGTAPTATGPVAITQFIAVYLAPNYRLGLLVTIPTLYLNSPAAQNLLQSVAANNVHLP